MCEVTEHSHLGPSVVKREKDAIDKMKAPILSHGKPFSTEADQLRNLITYVYIPESTGHVS